MIVQIDRVGFNRALLKSSSWLVGMLVLRLGLSFSSFFPNYNDLNKNTLAYSDYNYSIKNIKNKVQYLKRNVPINEILEPIYIGNP